jgi:hypothetical protein
VFAELGVRGQIAEGKHRMGLAAAHGLLEFEHGLAGRAGEALQSLPKERPHSAGDVGLPKERLGRLRIVPDEILKASTWSLSA